MAGPRGLLVLNHYPEKVTPFGQARRRLGPDPGLERGGLLRPGVPEREGPRARRRRSSRRDYERVRDEIKARLEATTDAEGQPLGTLVFKPEEIYRTVRNVAPDLIVHFGGLAWRSIGGVGYPTLHVRENDTGPDDCNHAQHGAFILASTEQPARRDWSKAPTCWTSPRRSWSWAATTARRSMRSPSFATAQEAAPQEGDDSARDETIVRDRLSGLGYI